MRMKQESDINQTETRHFCGRTGEIFSERRMGNPTIISGMIIMLLLFTI